MAVILDQITVGDHLIYSLDTDPREGSGTPAIVGTIGLVNSGANGTIGEAYIKVGPGDADWRYLATSSSSNVPVESGSFRHFALYKVNSVGDIVKDSFTEAGGAEISVFVQDQAARTLDISYRVPNPGDTITSADFVLTEGDQIISGDKSFQDNVVIQGNLDVNGTVTTIDTVNLQVTDKLITLNRQGAALSGGGAGIEIEEDASITGYFKTSADREQWCLKTPAVDWQVCFDLDKLTADRVLHVPDSSGTLVTQPTAPTGVANQLTWWLNGSTITAETGVGENSLTWDDSNNFLGVQTPAPQSILQLFNQSTSGTVDPTAVILGKHSTTANIGATSLLTGGTGGLNEASGDNSFVHGKNSIASGLESSAQGSGVTASGDQSHAEGLSTIASGTASHAEGDSTQATGLSSHAQGTSTQATGDRSFAAGRASIASGDDSTAIGVKALTGANSGAMILTDSQDFTSTVDSSDRMKMRFQDGWDLVKGGGANNDDGVNFKIRQSSVSTSDATVSNVQSIAIPTNCTVMIKSKIVGARTGGTAGVLGDSAAYERTSVFKNINGSVTVHKRQSDYTFEDQSSWNGLMSVSGTDAVIQVQGAANNNVSWHVTSYIQIVPHS